MGAGCRGRTTDKAGKPIKRPQYIHRVDGDLLAVAGIWSAWRDRDADEDGPWLHTVSVITTSANECMAPVHDRMPVILPGAMWGVWLDPSNHNLEMLSGLLVPAGEEVLTMHEVSTEVNNVRNKGIGLIARVENGQSTKA